MMNKKDKNYIFTILIIVIIIFIIFLAYMFSNYHYESFDNPPQTFGMQFQSGTSGISTTGTITFNIPFTKPPLIFTQIMPPTDGALNVYSVQIFNVTNKSFDYSKNKVINLSVSNENVNNMTIMKLNKAELEPFNWIAFA